jgi:hypothetical protein
MALVPMPLAPTLTSAPAVDPQTTMPRVTHLLNPSLFPIVTPLRWERWSSALKKAGILADFSDIPCGIRDGFPIGVSSTIISVFSPPNHKSALDHSDFISSQIEEEIALGRYSQGLEPALFLATYGPYRTSPLGVIAHPTTGKLRLIQDHSYPRNDPCLPSINSEIDSSLFQCDWSSFADCYVAVLDAAPDTEVAVFDVKSAHRRMPIRPQDRNHVCVAWKGRVHMDHCCCFGCASSSGIFGRCADAVKAIFTSHGVGPVLKWADDFTFWRQRLASTGQFTYDEHLIWDIAADLGWPWAPEKCLPFSRSFPYLGFIWDLDSKTVALEDRKRIKFLHKLLGWDKGQQVSLKDCLSLIGSLNHCSIVTPMSRTHLPSFYRFSSRFDRAKSFSLRRVTAEVAKDAAWWRLQLDSSHPLQIKHHPPTHPVHVFVDASTSWGIGFVFNRQWLAWPLLNGWDKDGRKIGWAEFVALELAILSLANHGLRNFTFKLFSDNSGVVGAFRSSMSRSPAQNNVLRRILILLQEFNMWLTITWIASESNPADDPSRGIFKDWTLIFPSPPKVPRVLSPFLGHCVQFCDYSPT